MPAPLRLLDLFSGIGGFSYAAERLVGGFTTVQFVEREPFCQGILRKHWPAVPIHDDICTFQPEPGSADVVCGGFPCQDISTAGKQAGIKEGTRSGLFYELIRVVRVVRPRFVVLENVAAIVSNGLDTVLGELAAAGYDAEWACIPASAVGACHRRDRWWCVAYRAGWDAGAADASGVCGERWGEAGDLAGAAGAGEADRQQRERNGNAADDCGAVAADTSHMQRHGGTAGHGRQSGPGAVPQSGNGRSAADSNAHGERLKEQHPPALAARAGQPAWPPAAQRLNPDWRAYVSEPVLCRGDDGFSAILDSVGRLISESHNPQSLAAADQLGRETLRELWRRICIATASSELRQPRGSDPLSKVPYGHPHERWNMGQRRSAVLGGLRDLWHHLSQETIGEDSDLLATLSIRAAAAEIAGAVGFRQRVDRLKALGNAVVPQMAMIPLARVLELAGR